MSRIALETRRPWNWKTFLVLVALIVPAAFAIVPFSVHRLTAYGSNAPGWQLLFADTQTLHVRAIRADNRDAVAVPVD